MKLRISSCKKTAFWKNVTRFFPVWLGWLLFRGLILLTISDEDMDFWFPSNIASTLQVIGIFTCGYALLVAQILFGDLFSSRMCNALHAMPLRREHWFGIHIRSGLGFCLIPSAVVALAASFWLWQGSTMVNGWQIPLYWWTGTNLMYLFFFGLAVFSVMCVGNRLAITVVYGMLNFASVLVMFLADSLYIPLLHGLITPTEIFTRFCPLVHTTSLRYLNCSRIETGQTYLDQFGVLQKEKIGQFTVFSEHWNYLVIIALLGILLLIAARRIYRSRHLECAGDFAAFSGLKPVFQVIMSLMATSAFGALCAIFFGDSGLIGIYITVGLTAGWFASKMLLNRSTRVFQPKNWLGLAVLAALLCGSLYLTNLDPLGIEDWMPRVSQVKSAQLRMLVNGTEYNAETPAEITDFLRIHSLALEDRITEEEVNAIVHPDTSESDQQFVQVYLSYTLENGLTSQRRYYIPVYSEEGELAKSYFSRTVSILRRHSSLVHATEDSDIFALVGEPQHLTIINQNVPQECMTADYVKELLTAIDADCKEGHMVQYFAFHEGHLIEGSNLEAYYLDLYLKNGNHLFLHIYPECVNTLAVLEKTGIPEQLRQNPTHFYG